MSEKGKSVYGKDKSDNGPEPGQHKGFVKTHAGPGPGAYMLPETLIYKDHDPTRYRYPQYSMGLKTHGFSKAPSPGPQYDINNATRFGHPGKTRFHMGIKPNDLATFKGPGPGAYSPGLPGHSPPKYSFGQRVQAHGKSTTPGPNAYKLPSTIAAGGGFSMGGRHDMHSKFQTPGPAAYGGTQMDKYKPSAPKYSMGLRTNMAGAGTVGPGPGAYGLEKPKPKGDTRFPKFGMKHTEFMTPAVTEADNMDAVYTTAPPVCE